MARTALFVAVLLLGGCDEPGAPSPLDGGVVVKICRDGTRVYRLPDGRFMASLPRQPVADPNTVCG